MTQKQIKKNNANQRHPSIEEIVPQGEIHDDSKENVKEQCQPKTQHSQERSDQGTPQRISQVERKRKSTRTNKCRTKL